MLSNYSEKIIDDSFFNLIKQDGSLIINLKGNNNVLISSWLNGGISHNLKNVVNLTVESDDYGGLDDGRYDNFQKNKFTDLGLDYENTAGLLTSACMDNYAFSNKKYEQLEVTAIVTAGADKNAVKAGDGASFYEYNNNYFNTFGTINIIVIIDANLDDGALVTASITATEAKSVVLQDLKIESQYSTGIATGTGTDGIAIISNKSSNNHIENAGKHSKLGELIAKSVIEATKEALYLQTFMSADFQSTVLSRLSRFNITFEDFYKGVSIDKTTYASEFYYFNNNKQNVAFVSMVLNLIDEINMGLLKLEDILKPLKTLFKSYLDITVEEKIENVNDIIDLLIKSINHHLFD
ncbi:MAG TPA: adenosylcobinamide amidohydrolase [Methanosphaera sp.]|nr:adenosylcobinamide amidohydrolase [Methanosphaera sp.]HII08302.1 adenosylcobinamide amidohydrolase [Methanosphaera sp.]HIJ15530.1 adenosylcobinamide amidohydrolase [Methanosphaera sp.]